MKKTNIKTRMIAGIMAVICTVSMLGVVSAVSASAAVTNEAAVSAQSNAKACVYTADGKTSYGYDWDYRADNSAAKISCTYDFKTNKYIFKAVGQFAGTTNAVLKYATIDGKWHNVPIRFTTDRALNVTGVQTGKEYVTNNRYSG